MNSLSRMRIYLHLVPVFGVVPSLWTLYGKGAIANEVTSEVTNGDLTEAQLRAASRLSVLLGISFISAIILLAACGSTQASQVASLRFLMASSFVGSGYFVLNVSLMFRVAKGKSIRLPGVSQLSRRLP